MPVNPSGNFHWIPDFALEETRRFGNIKTQLEGKTRYRMKHGRRHSWTLNFAKVSKTEANDIWAFWNKKEGAFGSFNWTHPETSVAYKVRFAGDSLKREEIGGDLMRMTIRLIEVF